MAVLSACGLTQMQENPRSLVLNFWFWMELWPVGGARKKKPKMKAKLTSRGREKGERKKCIRPATAATATPAPTPVRHPDKTRGTVEQFRRLAVAPRRNSRLPTISSSPTRLLPPSHPTPTPPTRFAPQITRWYVRSNGSGAAAAVQQPPAIGPLPRRLQVPPLVAALIVSDVIVGLVVLVDSILWVINLVLCVVGRGGAAPMEPPRETVAPPPPQGQQLPPLFLDFSRRDGGNCLGSARLLVLGGKDGGKYSGD